MTCCNSAELGLTTCLNIGFTLFEFVKNTPTRIKSSDQCQLLYFDYLFPLMVLLAQKESMILDINDFQYRVCQERGIVECTEYTDLNELEYSEINIPITVDIDDYITRRLLSLPNNPREAIEQAAITCTERIIKQYGHVREVHFTEKMYLSLIHI